MSALERTAIGGFAVEDACTLEQLTAETLATHLLPALRAVDHLPRLTLGAAQIEEMAHGRVVPGTVPGDAAYVAAVDHAGTLLGVLRTMPSGLLQPHRNFVSRH